MEMRRFVALLDGAQGCDAAAEARADHDHVVVEAMAHRPTSHRLVLE
jgi:hypothetical protein